MRKPKGPIASLLLSSFNFRCNFVRRCNSECTSLVKREVSRCSSAQEKEGGREGPARSLCRFRRAVRIPVLPSSTPLLPCSKHGFHTAVSVAALLNRTSFCEVVGSHKQSAERKQARVLIEVFASESSTSETPLSPRPPFLPLRVCALDNLLPWPTRDRRKTRNVRSRVLTPCVLAGTFPLTLTGPLGSAASPRPREPGKSRQLNWHSHSLMFPARSRLSSASFRSLRRLDARACRHPV